MGAWAGDRVSIGVARTQSVNSKLIAALGASEASAVPSLFWIDNAIPSKPFAINPERVVWA